MKVSNCYWDAIAKYQVHTDGCSCDDQYQQWAEDEEVAYEY